jgi:c-di-GMP-binding flagellar brake protein YcgR
MIKIGKLEDVDTKDASGKKDSEQKDEITETDVLGFRVSNISAQDRQKLKTWCRY